MLLEFLLNLVFPTLVVLSTSGIFLPCAATPIFSSVVLCASVFLISQHKVKHILLAHLQLL